MTTSYREGAPSVNHPEACVTSSPSSTTAPQADECSRSRRSSSEDAGILGGKTRITCPLTVVNGLDFLKVSFWLAWDSTEIFRELDALKTCVQSTEENSIPYHAPGGFDWNLHRTGTSRYSYRLSSGDLTLLLNTRRGDGVVPTARLEIGSLSCWSPGFFTIYERMIQWLKALGASIVKEIVSEVHLAADFLHTDISTLSIENEDRWVSRVHKFNIHRDRRKLSGITMGKGDIMLRIYDKVLELRNSPHKQVVFAEIWKAFVYDQFPVTRVEFQIRRTVINEFENKIITVKNLLFSLQALWTYCTHSWSRFCEKAVDRNHNQSKASNASFWDTVAHLNWTGIHKIERKKRRKNKSLDHIRANMRGMAMTAGAFHDISSDDLEQIIEIAQNIISVDLSRLFKEDSHSFITKMNRKKNEIYANI